MYEVSKGEPLISERPPLHMYFPLHVHGKERPGAGHRTPVATRVLEDILGNKMAREQNYWDDSPLSGPIAFMARCLFDRRPGGDWDNLGKILADSLNGITYHDDRQIIYGSVEIRQSDEPGVSLTLVELKDDFKIGRVPR